MAICKTITHLVQPGDTFYRLAQHYQTTVPDIIMRNPGVNPYNLQIGTRLNICSNLENEELQGDELELNNDMRQAWTQHAFWAMIFQTSLFNRLANLEDVQMRFMQTPEDIAGIFEKFYSPNMTNQLAQLLNEHVRLTGEIMTAMRDNEMQTADQLEREWFQNAEKTARMLSAANTEYSYDELLRYLTRHLDMLKRQMMTAINGEYNEEIRIFDENENQLMELADYLTEGLLEQFYRS